MPGGKSGYACRILTEGTTRLRCDPRTIYCCLTLAERHVQSMNLWPCTLTQVFRVILADCTSAQAELGRAMLKLREVAGLWTLVTMRKV